MAVRIASQRVVLPDAAEPVAATIEVGDDGHIAQVVAGVRPDSRLVEAVVVPGFVDTHCHGAAGAAFTDADTAAAIALHRRHGTTTQIASTVTASIDEVHRQLDHLRPFVQDGELAGVHLEGPFLSPARKGAHTESLLVDPTSDRVAALAADPVVRMVTLAPERQDALEAVRTFTAHGVRAAFGHSDADAPTTQAGIDAGMDVATHLFNAMRGINHREPGPVPVLLTDPRVMVELICDGVHLAPEVVRMAVRAAGPDRVALVTDAMSATGAPDGAYDLGGLAVQVVDGVARLATADGSPGAIAGSTLTMDRAVRFVIGLGVPVADAARMAATTPARWHGLDDVGAIEAGRWADLCLLDDDGVLLRVLRRGRDVAGAGTRHDGLLGLPAGGAATIGEEARG